MTSWIEDTTEGVILRILVQPRASKSDVVGLHDDRLKIRLKAPPVDGAANKELIAFLSKKLRYKKQDVVLTNGLASRRKTILVKGAPASSIQHTLCP